MIISTQAQSDDHPLSVLIDDALGGHDPTVVLELETAPMDADAPGREAAKKLADRATIAGWQVRIIRCPDGSDWNDLAQEAAA